MLGEVLGKLGFDWKVALANLVNFLIIYYLLRNVVFKKLGHAIKERQEKIQKGLDDAQRAETTLMMAESEKEGIVKKAHHEAVEIAEKAFLQAEEAVSEAKEEARKQAEAIQEEARQRAEKAREEAEKKLQKEYVAFVMDGVRKVARESIDEKTAERFTKTLLP